MSEYDLLRRTSDPALQSKFRSVFSLRMGLVSFCRAGYVLPANGIFVAHERDCDGEKFLGLLVNGAQLVRMSYTGGDSKVVR